MDRLPLLVSDMKMTRDRKQCLYKPKIYQGRSWNQNRNKQNFMHLEIGPFVEEEIKEITTIGIIIGQIIEIDREADGTTICQVIEVITIRIIIDEVIQDQIIDKMPNGLLGTDVCVEIEMMTILEVEVETKIIVGLFQGEERRLAPNLTSG